MAFVRSMTRSTHSTHSTRKDPQYQQYPEAPGFVGEEWLPLKLLAYWEETEHSAGVDEEDVLCSNQGAALF